MSCIETASRSPRLHDDTQGRVRIRRRIEREFPLNYNDVDYCLRLIVSGRRIVYTPYSQLYHYESLTRPKGVEDEVKRFEDFG